MSFEDSEKARPVAFGEGIRGIWRHVRPYRQTIGVMIALGLASAVANGLVPYITGRFFDALIALSRGQTVYTAGIPYWALLLIGWVLIRLVTDGSDWLTDRRKRWLQSNLQPGIQAEGFAHLLQLPLAFHTNEHIESLFSRINGASWRVTGIVGSVTDIAPQLLSIIIGISLAYSINSTLADILVAGVMGYAIALVLLLRGTAAMDTKAHRAWNDTWNDAAAAVTQVAAVKQAAADDYEIARIRHSMRGEVVTLWYQNELVWSRVNFWQRVTVFLTQLAIFIVSVFYISSGVITVGQLVALNGYALMFFGPLVSLGYSWQVMQNGITSAGMMERIFQEPQERYHPPHAIKTGGMPGQVDFEEVDFKYGEEERPVLESLTFSAKAGQSIAFVGESGVGKSTIVSLISAYYFPTKGRVLVDGVDTREWDLLALRGRIAVVPQEVALFNDTIRANVRYGAFGVSDAAVEQAAREAHIHDFILRQPKGYDTLVGERGIKLSVGQKQRIAIARAILRNPEFLILDEPTSALDVETERYITEALSRLMRGRTTFIIAHRLSTIRKADSILVIKDGKVAEQGTHDGLVAKKGGIYRRLHDLHVGLYE